MSTATSDDKSFSEWQEARTTIARFDNNLHDLRKYGFSFVTALLAANGLLSQGGTSIVPDIVKVGVLIATLGLVVVLRLLDTHYRLFQRAASIRARILENRLNLDITNDISAFYDLEGWWKYVQYLYYGFVLLAAGLGFALLFPQRTDLLAWVGLSAVFAILLVHVVGERKQTALVDWSVDRKIVTRGTPVRITFTNLNPENPKAYREFNLQWRISPFPSDLPAQPEQPRLEFLKVGLRYFESYDWIWPTNEHEGRLYSLEMWTFQEKPEHERWDFLKRPVKETYEIVTEGQANVIVWHSISSKKHESEKEEMNISQWKKTQLMIQIIPKPEPAEKPKPEVVDNRQIH